MDALRAVERRIEILERVEKPVCFAVGALLALAYFLVQLRRNYFATYTWMIPFAVGYAIPLFGVSVVRTKLENQRRAIADPASLRELPVARMVAPPTPARAPLLAETRAPEVTMPADPDHGPRILS